MADLSALADLLEKLNSPHPLVRAFDLSPRTVERLKDADVPTTEAAPFGIEIRMNPVLLDHMALLRFADGRLGYWDMRTTTVRLIPNLSTIDAMFAEVGP